MFIIVHLLLQLKYAKNLTRVIICTLVTRPFLSLPWPGDFLSSNCNIFAFLALIQAGENPILLSRWAKFRVDWGSCLGLYVVKSLVSVSEKFQTYKLSRRAFFCHEKTCQTSSNEILWLTGFYVKKHFWFFLDWGLGKSSCWLWVEF